MSSLTPLSLNLKLCDLVPLGSLLSISGEALFKYARSTQNSGSDLVTEHDLLSVFGRCYIDRSLGDAFAKRVRQMTKSQRLFDLVSLEMGAGPTVKSALPSKDYSGSFAMVVQLSFLRSLHRADSLSEAISAHEQKLAVEAQQRDMDEVALPDAARITGVINACQEQTIAWDWQQYLFTVADVLQPSTQVHTNWAFATEPIDGNIFAGLIQSLPLVQRFPTQYRVEIRTPSSDLSGLCAVVVWTYHVCGIPTQVRKDNRSFDFGTESTQASVQINIDLQKGPFRATLALFEATETSEENLFSLSSDSANMELDGLSSTRAKGLGFRWLRQVAYASENIDSVVIELCLMTCGLALVLLEHVTYDSATPGSSLRLRCRPTVHPTDFLRAAEYVFQPEHGRLPAHYTIKSMSDRQAVIATSRLSSLQALFNTEDSVRLVRSTMHTVASVLLAFCHVKDLEACEDMPCIDLSRGQHRALPSSFHGQLDQWDGMTTIAIRPAAWFEILRVMIDENFDAHHDSGLGLISRRG